MKVVRARSAPLPAEKDGARSHAGQEPPVERRSILRAAVALGVYAGAFGASFGALAATAGLTLPQTMTLSLGMFTGASQFAFIGVVSAGASPFAAVPAALLLGLRNCFYGVPITAIVRPRGLARLWTAYFVIDETTAMAVAQPTRSARRYAFWATGLVLCLLWVLGTLGGAALGASVDTSDLGLDAAAPAVFLALLWPQMKAATAPIVAIGAGAVAAVLIPVAPQGVPVIAAAAVAVVAGLTGTDAKRDQVRDRPAKVGR